MKSALPFFALLVVFASCTAAYKSGQTPDDVYYSPAKPSVGDEYVRAESKQPKYQYDEPTEDDRYLRMKVRNRRTWSDLDFYYSEPYAYNYYNSYYGGYNTFGSLYYNTPWNYYSSWNFYHNPYSSYYNNYYSSYYGRNYGYSHYPRVTGSGSRPPVYNHPRQYNLNVYNTPNSNGRGNNGSRRVYRGDDGSYNYNNSNSNNNYNTSRDAGRSLRNTFGSNSNNSNQVSSPSRSERNNSSSSSTPSSPSRSSSSSNAPVRRF